MEKIGKRHWTRWECDLCASWWNFDSCSSKQATKVKGILEQERIARKDPQLTSETTPDCQQHQSDPGSKNEEVSHSEENIPESTSDLDTESQPLEEDEEHHQHDTEMATRIDPARIEPGQIITYDDMGIETKISAKVLSKAGKATGRNKNWYNIQCLEPEEYEGERMSVDLTKMSGLVLSTTEPTPTTNSEETLMIMNEVSFENLKKEELESWKKSCVHWNRGHWTKLCFHQMGLYTQRNKGWSKNKG